MASLASYAPSYALFVVISYCGSAVDVVFPVLCLKDEKPYKQTIIVIQGIDFPGKVTRRFLENASGMLV